MLNLITNLSLWLLFIRSDWSIFTLFQLPKAISCYCANATVSTNHPSLLTSHTYPIKLKSTCLRIIRSSISCSYQGFFFFFSDSIDLEYFYWELDISNPSAKLHSSHYPRCPLFPICSSVFSTFGSSCTWYVQYFCLLSRLQLCWGLWVDSEWWHICTYTVCSRRFMCIVLR